MIKKVFLVYFLHITIYLSSFTNIGFAQVNESMNSDSNDSCFFISPKFGYILNDFQRNSNKSETNKYIGIDINIKFHSGYFRFGYNYHFVENLYTEVINDSYIFDVPLNIKSRNEFIASFYKKYYFNKLFLGFSLGVGYTYEICEGNIINRINNGAFILVPLTLEPGYAISDKIEAKLQIRKDLFGRPINDQPLQKIWYFGVIFDFKIF